MSESGDAPAEHRSYAPQSVRCLVVTVSDSRTAETDTAGDLIDAGLRSAGHRVVARAIVRDEPGAVRDSVLGAIERPDVDAAIVTGGTGVSPRDTTPDTVEPLLERLLPGFGELFRWLSYEEVGAAALLSRSLAGTTGRTVVFVLPGAEAAVRLAMDRLILPELAHIVGQLRR